MSYQNIQLDTSDVSVSRDTDTSDVSVSPNGMCLSISPPSGGSGAGLSPNLFLINSILGKGARMVQCFDHSFLSSFRLE